ncbi:MAG: hypothetical protein GQ582_09880 [Methyloprofundus sp.]|nr:hypothetical protein [Methyloprofundus sp.]
MSKPFLCLFLALFSFSSTLFAHAGVDHGDNCFVHVGSAKLRLGGFQAEEKIGGGKHYCHLFPATGTVIFTFEADIIQQLDKKMNIKFLAADSYWDVIFDNANAFQQELAQTSDGAKIQYNFPTRGLYAMQVELQDTQKNSLAVSQNSTQRFLFLVGFPLIKILIFIALGFFLLLIFALLRQLREGAGKGK